MNDMNKEIIFRDGWTLEKGETITQKMAACAADAINQGYKHGLKLNEFSYDPDMIFFEWCGSKQAVMDWYTYVSVNMCRESEEERNRTLKIISNK